MRCLHLLSDWKWTGPAEPVVSLCSHLASVGVDVRLAFRKAPDDFKERTIEKEAARSGVPMCDAFRLNRYFSPRDWLFDLRAIGTYCTRNRIDILHCHLTHDHALAAASLVGHRERPLLVRTDHKRDGLGQGFFMRRLIGRTDGLVTYSTRIRDLDTVLFSFPPDRIAVLPPGVTPHTGLTEDLRKELGLAATDRVIGVIGRLKPDRGYDVILKGFKRLLERVDGVKLVIVGRSSQIGESVEKPLAALGIEKSVILAGYRVNDYFSMVSTFDVFVMMRAGSDGTARALREVMAMGKPALVSDRGMLPELVEDGVDGFVASDERALAEAMEKLVTDQALRTRLGDAARKKALEKWDYKNQARRLIEFYERLLAMGRRK
ncbi:MAG TPA: glycosyltransferase family 4 protein [Syntrophorhabdales bacterium]|nr:glycosyltransferase family 4 protein [Syntrophorhabdales bacterium]